MGTSSYFHTYLPVDFSLMKDQQLLLYAIKDRMTGLVVVED